MADDVTELHVAGLDGWPSGGEAPALWLNNVRGGIVETGIATHGVGTILRVTGEDTERITLGGATAWTPESIQRSNEVAPTALAHAAGLSEVARR
jgi:hypothetical protein